jgi:hypothetical protein
LKFEESSEVSEDDSLPPQELEMYPATAAAAFSATNSPLLVSSLASTSTMLHSGQIAEAMSRSSDSSRVQSSVAGARAGSGEVWPFWLSLVKLGTAGSPAEDR